MYRHYNPEGVDSDERTHTPTGLKLTENVESLKIVGKGMKVPVVDMHYDFGINKFIRPAYFSEADADGRRMMGERYAGELTRLFGN